MEIGQNKKKKNTIIIEILNGKGNLKMENSNKQQNPNLNFPSIKLIFFVNQIWLKISWDHDESFPYVFTLSEAK
jgi:hypothetical protein